MINGSDYELAYRVRIFEGSCLPFEDTGTNQNQVAADLLQYGQHTQTAGNIPVGSCRTGSLIIREVSSGDVIDIAGITIDNV